MRLYATTKRWSICQIWLRTAKAGRVTRNKHCGVGWGVENRHFLNIINNYQQFSQHYQQLSTIINNYQHSQKISKLSTFINTEKIQNPHFCVGQSLSNLRHFQENSTFCPTTMSWCPNLIKLCIRFKASFHPLHLPQPEGVACSTLAISHQGAVPHPEWILPNSRNCSGMRMRAPYSTTHSQT